MKPLLLILSRWPEPHLCKTRLAQVIGPEEACEINRAMLADTLATFVPHVQCCIVCLSTDDPRNFYNLCCTYSIDSKNLSTMCGTGQGMNADIEQAYQTALERYTHVALISSDLPHYSLFELRTLYASLDSHDVAFHPSSDDGCCPHGLRRFAPLWRDNDSRLPGYIDRFLARCRHHNLSPQQLDPVFDVDTMADLDRAVSADYDCPFTKRVYERCCQLKPS